MRDERGVSAAQPGDDDGSRFSLKRTVLVCAAVLALATAACDRFQGAGAGSGPTAVSAAALKTAAADPAVKAFYAKRGWKAAWSEASAESLVQALQTAPRHGLNVSRFAELVDESNTGAAREARLTQAALSYAEALAHGAVNPKKVEKIWALDGPTDDLAAGLNQALQSGSVDAWLASLAPRDAEYAALSQAYVAAKAQADQAAAAPIPPGPTLRVGSSDPRVVAIAQRLIGALYLAGTPQTGADGVFTPQIAAGVKALQRDAGRPQTGVVDDAALALINEAPAALSRQLAVNMERRRWLKREVPATRVDVNTAAAELVYFHDGRPAWTGRAIVGDPEHQTPALGSPFKQLVVNPPWNVPEGIAAEELLPKGEDYLARNHFTLEEGRLVQQPGPDAALGQVKFDMQNPHAIYLHDTPAKALFASDARHRSHGCVRVERAVEFARMLAQERGKAAEFDTALASGETTTVELGESIPVRLLYHTAYLGPNGQLVVTADPYGRDDDLAEALGLTRGSRRGAAPLAHLLGP